MSGIVAMDLGLDSSDIVALHAVVEGIVTELGAEAAVVRARDGELLASAEGPTTPTALALKDPWTIACGLVAADLGILTRRELDLEKLGIAVVKLNDVLCPGWSGDGDSVFV